MLVAGKNGCNMNNFVRWTVPKSAGAREKNERTVIC